MNQVFHLVMKRGVKQVRLPVNVTQKYNSKTCIGDWESRQFLECMNEPFGVITVDDTNTARIILRDGYMYNGSHWHVATFYIRDDAAVFIMLNHPSTVNECHSKLNLKIDLQTPNDQLKASKYLKRLFAHHREYIEGEIVKVEGEITTVKLPTGRLLTVRHAPNTPMTDGMHLVSMRCVRLVEQAIKQSGRDSNVRFGSEGTGLRITALDPTGLSKGHAIVLQHLKYDLVLFDTKKMVKSGKFVLGLDELHASRTFTDVQSVVNYRLSPFLLNWAVTFMRKVVETVPDEEKLREMLGFYKPSFHIDAEGDQDDNWIENEVEWSLLRAMRDGISITDHPSLLRKAYRIFTSQVMDCEKKVRIPIPPELGGARYMMVDPTIFDENGNPTLPGLLEGNQVYIPDHVGPVVFHRQPNGHRMEHFISTSVAKKGLIEIDTGSFMFISRDVVVSALKALGGGDQDDRAVYYKDKGIVDSFANLPPYPITNVPTKDLIGAYDVATNRFLTIKKPTYSKDNADIMLAKQGQSSISIGRFVNPIMVDTVLTDEETLIVNYLEGLNKTDSSINQTVKVLAALDAMIIYPGNLMRKEASNLESIIDSIKRDFSSVSASLKSVKDFWSWLPVIPEFCLRGGYDGRGRLPEFRRGANHPVIVKTSIDYQLDEIKKARIELEDAVVVMSWQMIPTLPMEITTYPVSEEAVSVATAIRMFYNACLNSLMSQLDELDSEGRMKAYLEAEKRTYTQFAGHPLIDPAMIEVYKYVYDQRRELTIPALPNGRPKPYPDGILWGPYMSGLTVHALNIAGLGGKFAKVDLYEKRFGKDVYDVTIEDSIVTQSGTGIPMGKLPLWNQLPVTQTKMEHGYVKTSYRDAVSYQPPIKTELLTVVGGFMMDDGKGGRMLRPDITEEQIAAWKSHINEQVKLVPYVREGIHAVKVLIRTIDNNQIDWIQFGHITDSQSYRVTRELNGWLWTSQTRLTLTVMVDTKSLTKKVNE